MNDLLEFPLQLDLKEYYNEKKNGESKSLYSDSSSNNDNNKNCNDNIINSTNIETSYELSSIVVHEGSGKNGHYICYARPNNLISKHTNKW